MCMKINMLTTMEAAARLGVKPATLYAYVSRGVLSRIAAADGQRSLFRKGEVEALARRGRPRAAQAADELRITSAITELGPSLFRYRGHDVVALTQQQGFESVAELLWSGELTPQVRWPIVPLSPRVARAIARLPAGTGPLERYLCVTTQCAADDPLRIDLGPAQVMAAARNLVGALIAALPLLGPGEPAAGYVAERLWPRLSPQPAGRARVALLDAALVLLADHELATSTLAARVAASARAHPFAVLAAGFAALSGPLHGKAATAVQRVLRAARHTTPPARAWADAHGGSRLAPGFGHPVYTRDVRAVALYARLLPQLRSRDRTLIEAVRLHGEKSTGKPFNIDFVLAAMATAFDMPLGATEAVFALARSAGMLAHAIEEYAAPPLRFRARATYVGP
jgi:citrate synthase